MNNKTKTKLQLLKTPDETLLEGIQKGDEKSMFYLLTKYESHSKKVAFLYQQTIPRYSGIAFEELYQVCLAAVFSAAKAFKKDKNNQFYSYWKGIASKSMVQYVMENSYTGKAKTFAGDVSLDEMIYGTSNDNTYGDILGETDERINKGLILEDNKNFINIFCKSLSKEDKEIFSLLINDYDRDEIAMVLDTSKKRIYNKVSILKKKFSEFVKNHN